MQFCFIKHDILLCTLAQQSCCASVNTNSFKSWSSFRLDNCLQLRHVTHCDCLKKMFCHKFLPIAPFTTPQFVTLQDTTRALRTLPTVLSCLHLHRLAKAEGRNRPIKHRMSATPARREEREQEAEKKYKRGNMLWWVSMMMEKKKTRCHKLDADQMVKKLRKGMRKGLIEEITIGCQQSNRGIEEKEEGAHVLIVSRSI